MPVYCVLNANQVLYQYSVDRLAHNSSSMATNDTAAAQSQAYCLRRANHMSDMIESFDRMFKDESMTDCALMCAEGHALKAHRMILSASSPFFRTVFDQMSNQWPNYPMVYLKDMPMSDLRAIIEFIYTGEVTVAHEQLESVIRSGEALRIKGLVDIDHHRRDHNVATASTTISRRRRRRRHRRKSDINEVKKEGDNETNNNDDDLTDITDDGAESGPESVVATDLSGHSRAYNESVGASEDGIEPSRLLEQSMITGDTQESNSISSTPHMMVNVDEDCKPVIFDEPISLISNAISNAITNTRDDCNSDSQLNNNTNDSEELNNYGTFGIPSIAGTSRMYNSLTSKGKSGFECRLCRKRFDVRYSLIRHQRVIHEQKSCHVCHQCGRRFTWKFSYLRHINTICQFNTTHPH